MEGYGKRVLIIDDNEDIQYVTAAALVHRDYNVFIASDGFEGSELMKKRRYDAVLVDYQMPRVNGLQFIEMCRVMWPETPIILMSADVWRTSRPGSVMGTFGCLGKPFDLSELIELVNQACRCHQGKRVRRFCDDRVARPQSSPLMEHDTGVQIRSVSQPTS
jgi:DNA-binding response OmpR family regulator